MHLESVEIFGAPEFELGAVHLLLRDGRSYSSLFGRIGHIDALRVDRLLNLNRLSVFSPRQVKKLLYFGDFLRHSV